MRQILVTFKTTDGNNEYDSNVMLTFPEDLTLGEDPTESAYAVARDYMADFFGEKMARQDRNDCDLFWDRGDVRNVKILSVYCLSNAEFDFLKHFLSVSSVKSQ